MKITLSINSQDEELFKSLKILAVRVLSCLKASPLAQFLKGNGNKMTTRFFVVLYESA